MDNILNQNNNILIIEDNTWIGNLVFELLDMEGYRAKLVDNADKALALLHQEKVSLIIMDIGLPGKNGNEFLAELAQLDPTLTTIPVVVISADISNLNPTPQVKEALVKPFDLEKLLTVVEQNI